MKTSNKLLKTPQYQKQCLQMESGDCTKMSHGDFCSGGLDLGTVVFYNVVEEEREDYVFNVYGFFW